MYYSNRDVRLQEMPRPKIGSGEILMRIQASGICGTDVMEWYRKDKVPLVLGHEVAGDIVEVGEGVKKYKVGDRIAAAHHVPCGTCHYCLNDHATTCQTLLKETHFDPGGFCEFVRLETLNVDRGIFHLPSEVTYEEGTFVEPLACVVRGQRAMRMKPGATVAVIGSGLAGMLHVQLAAALGAGRVFATDVSEFRLAMAKRLGADVVIEGRGDVPAEIRRSNNGMLADIVILCTGAPTAVQQAFNLLERGGTMLVFAGTDQGYTYPLSMNDVFWRREITLVSTYAGDRRDHMQALELIRAKKVDVAAMITHRFPLADAQKGFGLVAEARDSMKVIIEPQK
jgi:L-iditol 2-dehydrogenase